MAFRVEVLVVFAHVFSVEGSHAWYEFSAASANSTFEAMSSTQVWHRVDNSSQASVYGAMQFYFENGVVGYFGGQHHGLGQTTVDFAIWDFGNPTHGFSPSSQPMPYPDCQRFGGEGTGSHCGKAVNLLEGREYTFHVELFMKNATGAAWRASVIDETTGNETMIGALFLRSDVRYVAPSHSVVQVGYGALTVAMTTKRKAWPKTEPVDPGSYGGIGFMEYFLGGSFYSSFGWIGPRFFQKSSSFAAGGASVRRSRGPKSKEDGLVRARRILVDSEQGEDKSIMTGCIPGYKCGGDRVFFQMGPSLTSQPPAGTFAWIYNESVSHVFV